MMHTPTHIPIQHSQTTSHKREAYKSKTKETKQQKISYPRVKQCEGKNNKKVIQYVYDRSKQTNLGMTYLLPFLNLACSAETQIKENKKEQKQNTSQPLHKYTRTQNISFSHTPTHTHTKQTHLHSDTNKTSHFYRHHTFNHNVRACIIQRKRKREKIYCGHTKRLWWCER